MPFQDFPTALKSLKTTIGNIEEQVLAITSAFPDPSFIISQNGRYLNTVGGEDRSLYFNRKNLIGKNIQDVFPEQQAEEFLSVIHRAIDTESLTTLEYQIDPALVEGTPADGPTTPQWFEGRIYPIKQKLDNQRAVVWLAVNITKKKELENKLTEMAETDPLTGAYNRRVFLRFFKKEFARFKRYKTPLSVLLMDIDHFKQFNDTHGHDVGDLVLKELVNTCLPMLRESDLFARFGGEEFIVLLPNTAIDGARSFAERLREEIQHRGLDLESNGNTLSFQVSIGVSVAVAEDKTIDDPIKRADTALYTAKNEGRNCVRVG